jgi:hypothetical protein
MFANMTGRGANAFTGTTINQLLKKVAMLTATVTSPHFSTSTQFVPSVTDLTGFLSYTTMVHTVFTFTGDLVRMGGQATYLGTREDGNILPRDFDCIMDRRSPKATKVSLCDYVSVQMLQQSLQRAVISGGRPGVFSQIFANLGPHRVLGNDPVRPNKGR